MALRMRLQAKKPGFIKKRLISLKKAASAAVLAVRARKAAIAKIVKKYYPKLKTKSKSELSYGERGKISDIVKKKAGVIMKMAKRLIKDKKKQDVERRRSMNKPKE
jgi:cobalamin biosynthesis protein CbiG